MREEEESPDPQSVHLLLDDVLPQQDPVLGYASAIALSVFASDDSRYFQVFDPVYIKPADEQVKTVPVSMMTDDHWYGQSVLLYLNEAEALAKVLDKASYAIHLVGDTRPEAMILYNQDQFIWIRCALDSYPDQKINHTLALLVERPIAAFTPTPEFIDALKGAIKIKDTGEHGLTVRIESGTISISSPEHASSVRYWSMPTDLYHEDGTFVVDGRGLLAILTQNDAPIVICASDQFLSLYQTVSRSRVILKQYKR
jgi:hypothetical protein